MGSFKKIVDEIESGFWRHLGAAIGGLLILAVCAVATLIWKPVRTFVVTHVRGELLALVALLVLVALVLAIVWLSRWVPQQKAKFIMARIDSAGGLTVENVEIRGKSGPVKPNPPEAKSTESSGMTNKPPGIVPMAKPKMTGEPPGIIPADKFKMADKPPGVKKPPAKTDVEPERAP